MTTLRAAAVVTPAELLRPGWIRTDGAVLAAVGAGEPPRGAGPPGDDGGDVDLGDVTLLPGFVDIHCHGGGGASFGGGEEAARVAADFHRAHGTTTVNASLVTESPDVLRGQVEALARAADDGVVAGIHLEGPWLSEHHRGAHDPRLLRDPDPAEVDALLAAARGHVTMVTLAVERDGADRTVARFRDTGARVALGHSGATYEQTVAALDAGVDVATHLFNAMPAVHHRRPGPVPALLDDPRTVVELVCDGVHLHPGTVRFAIDHAGPDRVALITDAISAAGAADGDYELGPLAVEVRDGVAHIAGTHTIAGSTLTLDRALRFVVEAVGIDLVAAARMLATVPAAVLRLGDRGALVAGRRADVVVVGPDLDVRGVMVAGRWGTSPH